MTDTQSTNEEATARLFGRSAFGHSAAEEFIAGLADTLRLTERGRLSISAFDHRPERRRHAATVFPSFYAAVHDAWQGMALIDEWHRGFPACEGDRDDYKPDEHRCYSIAGRLRVELHAAGIRLSNDGNGSEVDQYDPTDAKPIGGLAQIAPGLSMGLFGVEPVPDQGIEQAQSFSAADERAWREAIARSEQPVMELRLPDGLIEPQRASGGLLARIRRGLGLD